MPLRILLTGGGGFVGHHTLEHLLKNTDCEVVVLDSFRNKGLSSRLRSVFEANPDDVKRVTVITHDLTSPIDIVTKGNIGRVDVIINNASESHVDRSITHPRPFIENNVSLAVTMLEYARTLEGLKLFVQVSTDEVYGPAVNGLPHPEYDLMLPSNPYSASKVSQEAIAISYWRTYDVPVVISNTMNIIGERQDIEKFVPRTMVKILAGEKVKVHSSFIDGKWVSGSRYYLHARNQADALLFAIDHCLSGTPTRFSEGVKRPHRFHVGGEREVFNDEMVGLIASYMGVEGEWIEYEDVKTGRAGHDLTYALERTTLDEWGWVAPIPFLDSLKHLVEWTMKNQEWLLPHD